MIEFDVAALSQLGFNSALADRAAACPMPTGSEPCLGRITEVHRESVRLHDGVNEQSARPLPRLEHSLADDDTALVVGDWVLAAADVHRGMWVHERIPPLTHIARRDGDGRRHPVVSNVDTALLVMGLDDDFNPRRLERYLALVHQVGVVPVVVLTKVDVVAQTVEALAARVDLLRSRIPHHIDVIAVNATDPSAARALSPYLQCRQTLVLLGSSGAGKSTLTNTLLGAPVQDTGPVRANDGRGKHTTTARTLHRLPDGACVIDTPGLRTLRPDADETVLAGSFADVTALAGQCRFRDCRHVSEPGCAVREVLDADRLRNYHKLVREVRRDSLTVLDRQRLVAEWKARGRAAKVKLKAKRGEG